MFGAFGVSLPGVFGVDEGLADDDGFGLDDGDFVVPPFDGDDEGDDDEEGFGLDEGLEDGEDDGDGDGDGFVAATMGTSRKTLLKLHDTVP